MEICISQLYQNLMVLGPFELILLLVHGGFFAILPATFGVEHKVHFQDVVNAPRFKSFVQLLCHRTV